ncbi:MAG: LamG domain-containing protein [Planctomycetes bacterium]|nr:LamG domain-containing protein [Planctomycetota bacterium]
METKQTRTHLVVTLVVLAVAAMCGQVRAFGGTVFAICPSGSALEFDGVDDYVSGSTSPFDFANTTFTVSAWFKKLNAKQGVIVSEGGKSTGWRLAITDSGQIFVHLKKSNSYDAYVARTTDAYAGGQWHHVAAVITTNTSSSSGNNADIYVDGDLVGVTHNKIGPYAASTTGWAIGTREAGHSYFFKGIIDEVAIYNRALSFEDVQRLLHEKPDIEDPSIAAYWNFDDGEGQIAADISGNGNDGTLGRTEDDDDSDPWWILDVAPVGICNNISVDIKPGSCPNPFNVKSKGVLPVAILGSEDFDVSTIVPTSIRLADVAPIRNIYEDVAGPVTDANECGCTTEGPDGYPDLVLKFKTQEVVDAIVDNPGGLTKGDILALSLTGELLDGGSIIGSDCIKLVGNVSRWLQAKGSDINEDGKVDSRDLAELAMFWLEKEER